LLLLIDVNEASRTLSLMGDTSGDAYEEIALPSGEIGKSIVEAFSNEDAAVLYLWK
jgi:hypothetical protein